MSLLSPLRWAVTPGRTSGCTLLTGPTGTVLFSGTGNRPAADAARAGLDGLPAATPNPRAGFIEEVAPLNQDDGVGLSWIFRAASGAKAHGTAVVLTSSDDPEALMWDVMAHVAAAIPADV